MPLIGHEITISVIDTDKYGRIVARIYYKGEDIGLLMIKSGNAWHYRQYDETPSYAAAEREARENRKGLWFMPNPVAPWEWRK